MVEKKSKIAGIIQSNPYVAAFHGVIDELLQGLVVIEHLKNDVISRKKLVELDKLYSYLRESKRIKNRQSVPRNNVEDIILTVCGVLDSGGGYERWVEATQPLIKSSNRRDANPLWPNVVREEVRDFGFKFESLGVASLGYSHYCLLNLYRLRPLIFNTIEELLYFDYQEVIETTITEFKSDYDVSEFEYEIKDNIYLVDRINTLIEQAFSRKLLEKVEPVKKALGLSEEMSSSTKIVSSLEKEDWKKSFIKKSTNTDVITLKIAKEDLEFAEQASTTYIINSQILNAIWGQVHKKEYLFRRDDIFNNSVVNQYTFWCSFKKEKISALKNHAGRTLSHKLLLRGLKFSHWLEKYRDKKTVIDAARDYHKTSECVDKSASTIKQAYEAVKSTAKKDVSQLINRQCMWMLKVPINEGIFVLPPLYMTRFNQIKLFIDSYNNVIEEPKLSYNYDDLVKVAASIMNSYNDAESGFKNSGIILKEFSRYDRQYKEKKLEELNDRARFI